MTDISTLIERLENADGPSRELDAEIAVAVHGDDYSVDENRIGYVRVPGFGSVNSSSRPALAFTSSVDAALTLLPKGKKVASAICVAALKARFLG